MCLEAVWPWLLLASVILRSQKSYSSLTHFSDFFSMFCTRLDDKARSFLYFSFFLLF